jgi:flagellum-specific ATP synthase
MINIGAYARGSNPEIDKAIDARAPANAFLRQDVGAACSLEDSFTQLHTLALL